MAIDYDPRIASLLHPERHETVFGGGTPSRLQLAVEAARLAYYRAEEPGPQRARLQDALARAGLSGLQCFSHALLGAQAFAAYDSAQRLAVLAFRGTQPDDLADYGVIAATVPLPWRGPGLVHAGFAAAFEALHAPIAQWLDGPARDRAALLVCGHSLGGALATLAAACWPAELVTLGAPRVGNQRFGTALAGRPVQRIVDCQDLVPKLPPRLFGYEHVGDMGYVTHRGVLATGLSAAQIAQDRRDGAADYARHHQGPGNCPLRSLADHAPANYLRAFFP